MIALIGASGFIGSEFARQLEERGCRYIAVGRKDCDLYSFSELTKYLSFHEVTQVINCAGYTGKPNVDACERDKTNCLAGNAVLPGVIGAACRELDIQWGHVSSGCIFTGRRDDGEGFTEEDPPNFSFRQDNCSFYSGTKALGEEAIADEPNCYVWRVRIPFSNVDSSRNYISKLMRYDRLLEAENSLSNLTEFAAAAIDCLDQRLPYGLYNLTNPGVVKTSEVVGLLKETGVTAKKFSFFDNESDFMNKAAKTPRSNCVLDSTKAIRAGLRLTPVHDSLRQSMESWIAEQLVAV